MRACGRATRAPSRPAASRCSRRTSRTWAATAARPATSACSPTSPATPATSSPRWPRPRAAAARAAARRIAVGYEELPAVFDPVDAVAPGAPLLHADSRGVGAARRSRSACARSRTPTSATASGSSPATLRAAFAEADVVVEEAFRTPSAAHVPMEPHAALARVGRRAADAVDRHADAVQHARRPRRPLRPRRPRTSASSPRRWAARSAPRRSCAPRRSSPRSRARPAGRSRPCSTATRSSSRSTATRRRSASGSAPRRDGTLVAKELDCWVDTGAYADCGPGVATKMGYAGVGPYRIPHVRGRLATRSTRTCRPTAPSAATARCSRCGRPSARWTCWPSALGMSPLELRRKNLLRDGDRFATGEVMHDVHFEELPRRPPPTPSATRPTRAARACACCSRACRRRAAPQVAIERTPVGYVVRSRLDARWARASRALDPADGRASCSAASPARSRSRSPTPTRRRSTRAPPRAARRT